MATRGRYFSTFINDQIDFHLQFVCEDLQSLRIYILFHNWIELMLFAESVLG